MLQSSSVGHAETRGAAFEFVPIDELPLWIQRLPRGLSELVAREFLQCAVAIGGSAPHLPRQQADLSAPGRRPRDDGGSSARPTAKSERAKARAHRSGEPQC